MKDLRWWSVPRVPALWRRSSAPPQDAAPVPPRPEVSAPRPVSAPQQPALAAPESLPRISFSFHEDAAPGPAAPAKRKQTSLALEVRQEPCDGSSGENIRIVVKEEHPPPPPPPGESDYATPPAPPPPVDDDYASPRPSEPRSDSPGTQASTLAPDYEYYEVTRIGGGADREEEAAADYEDLEYCEHRARRRRRGRTRLGQAWRLLRGWWSEERGRLGVAIQRQAHAQAVQATPPPPPSVEAAAVVVRRRATRRRDGGRSSSRVGVRRSRHVPENVPDQRSDVVVTEDAAWRSRGLTAVVDMQGARACHVVLGDDGGGGTRLFHRSSVKGQHGFEELRRYIKQGGDFCKDLSSILQERSEAETQYAKSLSKLSGKLLKASKDSVGTVNQAWQRAGTQMEMQSEIHRAFAVSLSEEVVKPLRQLVESQHRIRKSVEVAVDKTGKSLAEWRAAESKSKKQSFVSARENEKLQDGLLDVRLGRSASTHHLHHLHKASSDKDTAKLEAKRRKAEESVKKADVEYYTFCIRAERARLEWETAVIRGSHCFQALEEERLQHLKELAACYLQHLGDVGPKLIQSVEHMAEPVNQCDVGRDIQTVVSIKGTGQPIPEQLLPDFYAEHITLAMNRDRRRQSLVKILQLIRQDLDRERRGKQGVENLARALQQTPTFGTDDSQQNVSEKLHHMRSMLTYLEAARYKVQSALAELDGRARGSHPLAGHIQVTRDRQGLQQSVLKVPPWVCKESLDLLAGDSPDWTDRGAADGNSVQPDSDFDEFSSQGSEKDYQNSVMTFPVISECGETNGTCVGRCKVLYEYSANLYDELNLSPGDVINIHDKQTDGWWLGELNGVVGIFPATYVEEIK